MPTGIRITRHVDGRHQFSAYDQKDSSELKSSFSPERVVTSRRDDQPTATGSVVKTRANDINVDSNRKFNFADIDQLHEAISHIKLATIFLSGDDEECQLCPKGVQSDLKHIHVVKDDLAIINPYYKKLTPPLKDLACLTCNRKLGYICSGTCNNQRNNSQPAVYCSEACQKTNWPNHSERCKDQVAGQSMTTCGSRARNSSSDDSQPVFSPKVAAQQINSSIVIRSEPSRASKADNNGDRSRSSQDIAVLSARQPQPDTVPSTRQPEIVPSIRQPKTAPKVVKVDHLASLPRGLIKTGKTYNTCVLAPDDCSKDRLVVYIPYDNDKLKDVMDVLTSSAEEIEKANIPQKVEIGSTYLAQSADDASWYRAQVTEMLDGGHCKVYYIDFGSNEEVSKHNLRDIIGQSLSLANIPAVAVKCRFSDSSPPDLVEKALECEETFDMFVESYDEANKQFILTLL